MRKNIRIFFSGRYSRSSSLLEYALKLEKELRSYKVISRWLNGSHALAEQPSEDDIKRLAVEDFEDISQCDIFVIFTQEEEGRRGGSHLETGYALAEGKTMILIGPRKNVFHYLDAFSCFDTFEDFMKCLRKEVCMHQFIHEKGKLQSYSVRCKR